jgi:hypothetical protein
MRETSSLQGAVVVSLADHRSQKRGSDVSAGGCRVVVRGSICSPSCRGEASLPRVDGVVCVDEHAVDEFRGSPAPTVPVGLADPGLLLRRSGRGLHPTPKM